MTRPIDLVIFDCDGVLVDSEPIANRLLAEALSEVGLPTTYEQARRDYVGLSMASCVQLFEEKLGHTLPEDWVETLQKRTFERLAREVKPVVGVENLVRRVRDRGIQSCVASSGHMTKISLTLTATGLISLFEGRIFSASMVKRGKPNPDLFLFAADQMAADPSRTFVIEDSVPGVKAAVSAGMKAFGYAGDAYTDHHALAEAGAAVFTSMDAFPGLP